MHLRNSRAALPRSFRLAVLAVCIAFSLAPTEALCGTQLPTGAAAVPPAGFLGFCVRHLRECATKSAEAEVVELTPARERELREVQQSVNASIRPVEDPTHSWEYSTDGTGDCNRFALAKLRDLLARGWPRSSLLLATAVTERGEGHLVLVARTDRGDIVLDNRLGHPAPWSELPYRWVSVQSPQSPVQWLAVLNRPPAAPNTAGAVQGSP